MLSYNSISEPIFATLPINILKYQFQTKLTNIEDKFFLKFIKHIIYEYLTFLVLKVDVKSTLFQCFPPINCKNLEEK